MRATRQSDNPARAWFDALEPRVLLAGAGGSIPDPSGATAPLTVEAATTARPHTRQSAPASAAASDIAPAAPVAKAGRGRRGRAAAKAAVDRQGLADRLAPALRERLQPYLDRGDTAGFDRALLDHFERRAGPRFFFNPSRLRVYLRFMRRQMGQEVADRMQMADAVLAHRFPEQVNSADYTVQLGAAIDWDAPPDTTDNPDFLHSLNRHTVWVNLALGYRLSGDAAYARELVAQLESWSAQTPNLADPDDWPESSPRWWLLDAADRADNWAWTYFLMLGTDGWTPEANTLFLARLADHGDFLGRVGGGPVRANRTALHATGLLGLATMFPEFAGAAAWKARATGLMFRCLDAQFYPDGGHIEQTPAYHAGTLNAMVDQYLLDQLNAGRSGRGAEASVWTRKPLRKLRRAVEAYYQLLSPDGTLPGLSDTYRASDPLPFLTKCSFAFADPRYRLSMPRLEDALLIGPDRLKAADIPARADLPNRGPSYALPDAGYYMLRTAEYGQDGGAVSHAQVIVDAGPKGGTHGHYDLLSFELSAATLGPLVADPGPYRYDDSADRQWVVSTPAHNTISIDGLNHGAVEGAHNPAVVVDRFETTADQAVFSAHHTAYAGLAGAPVVGRTIWLDRRENKLPLMLVADYGLSGAGAGPTGSAGGAHTFTTSFTLPGDRATMTADGIVDNPLTRYYALRVQSLEIPLPGFEQSRALEDRFVSNRPPPDAKHPAARFAVSQTGGRALFVTLIGEYISSGEYAQDPPHAEFAEPPVFGKPLKIRLTTQAGETRLVTLDPPAVGFEEPAAPAARPAGGMAKAGAGASPFGTTRVKRDADDVLA